ncbi:TlpA family protein disulfide reductase [Butyrivibrio sp. YAB3001]|uniref:TlpA family protein disulfide reductase n=1 Tax=Butyrivibrio sp. YAB3001 TaxID=1520812 RepID=UPI0008F64A9B|nr:TlpA disulfide reductase family protein [Butyrivibrio sp. YAB3001]SFC48475.1 Thiol-disulfide isomerase or thioredoxin [Butyrivibrio sp. YAB3001]
MWEKIKHTLLISLATLGVLFIVLLLWPDDEDDNSNETSAAGEISSSQSVEVNTVASSAEVSEKPEDNNTEVINNNSTANNNNVQNEEQTVNNESSNSETSLASSNLGNTVAVNIPASELSRKQMLFKTVSLDNQTVTQDIFSEYDITIIHVWGTYCQPCIREMGDYANLYNELPSNVNLIGIVCDVYDGIDNNVSDANEILNDSGAAFINLRISDDIYSAIADIDVIPSSLFVDNEGHVIGEKLIGANFESTKKRLDEYLK